MFARILVPLDGSARAERAAEVAARLARSADGRVLLLNVISRPEPIAGAYYFSLSSSTAWIELDVTAAKAYLAEVANSSMFRGVRVETRVEIGIPATTILEVAETERSDLIVMCSHGRTGATRWLLGSVAEHVARHACAPLLALRECELGAGNLHATPEQPLRAIVALDGSHFAEAALGPTATLMLALAAPYQAAIQLAVVLSPAEVEPETVMTDPALQTVRSYLTRLAERMRTRYPRLIVDWAIITDIDVAHALAHAASRAATRSLSLSHGYDLIALTTHGRSGVSRWMLGSVTERTLHCVQLPLLVVRSHPDTREMASVTADHAGAF